MADVRRVFRTAGIASAVVALAGVAVAASANADPAEARPLIIGGQTTTTKENPFVVALAEQGGPQFCGGSLIAPNKVVTAAHCTEEHPHIKVIAGRTTLSTDQGKVANVTAIWVHPKHKAGTLESDVAVLTLDRKLRYTPIDLADQWDADLYAKGANSTAYGWGVTANWQPSKTLRKVTVPVVADSTCAKSYPKGFHPKTMVCAGLAEGGKDSCAGDSGGPLVGVTTYGTRKLIGVVSWGDGCAEPNKYGVYARVAAFSDSLKQQIGG